MAEVGNLPLTNAINFDFIIRVSFRFWSHSIHMCVCVCVHIQLIIINGVFVPILPVNRTNPMREKRETNEHDQIVREVSAEIVLDR